MVECHLPKVEVAGSIPVTRSRVTGENPCRGYIFRGKRNFPGISLQEKGAVRFLDVEGKTLGFALKERAGLGKVSVKRKDPGR